ncbi:MAG: GAF domain-containing protein [Xenococcaceae cyanobacterium MO_167.B27]|nr:GAF domain-containing protein [Xenococcaceae cyanobacterium MO_167.B27]
MSNINSVSENQSISNNPEKLPESMTEMETKLEDWSQHEHLIKEITNNLFKKERIRCEGAMAEIRQGKNLDDVLAITTDTLRRELNANRVLIYCFEDDTKGKVVMESLESGWTPAWRETLPSICFGAQTAEDYHAEKIVAMADVNQTRVTPYQRQLLDKFQVKASLAIPILVNSSDSTSNYDLEEVWGLLVIHKCDSSHQWKEQEINLAYQLSRDLTLALQQTESSQKQEQELERERALAKVVERIRKPQELNAIFRTVTQEVRELLKTDRAVVYRFNPDWSGLFIAESVGAGWTSLIVEQVEVEFLVNEKNRNGRYLLQDWEAAAKAGIIDSDTYLQETQGGNYTKGQRYSVVDDIYEEGFPDCYTQSLETYQAKAYVIAPIFLGEQLWGLFAVYQNSSPRHWEKWEIDLVVQIANQLGVAIQQAEYVEELQQKAEIEAKSVKRAKTAAKIIEKIRNYQDIETIFRMTTQEMRQALQNDRVVVYRFNPDWSGKFVAESVGAAWDSLMLKQTTDRFLIDNKSNNPRCLMREWSEEEGTVEPDSWLKATKGGNYTKGQKYSAVKDLYNHGFADCYIQTVERYQAKAYIIAPIFLGEELWGLLAAHQNDGARDWEQSEIDLMVQVADQLTIALQQAELIKEIKARNKELVERNEQETAIIQFSAQLVGRLRELAQKDTEVNRILSFAAKELRHVLKADRVGVYRFYPDGIGEFVVESFDNRWLQLVGTELAEVQDIFLIDNKGGRYAKGETLAVSNIYEAGYNESHLTLLEQCGTKAYAIAPIFKANELWGLLGIYQNDGFREWETFEMATLEQVATQIGVTVQLSEYLNQVRDQEQQLTAAAEREKKEKEKLQQNALKVLVALEPSFQGDLTVRAPLSDNEIGTIADGYNTTIQSLREFVRQVQTAATRVNETSGKNTTSVTQLSAQAQEQVEHLKVALTELQQMVAATQAVMNNAKQVKQAVQEANRIVQNGDSLMEKTVDGIMEVRETTAETAKKIKRLGEASQKISKVVNLIENFATQTNLLSLNAAIEATRAGEYGKGFAVVADEVRSLAYQSANATTEIERLVEEIQTEINEVNSSIEMGIAQVVQGSNLVGETRQSLRDIVQATSRIIQLVVGITNATATQNQQSQTLTAAMNDVSEIAHKTFESSTQISESFLELLTTSEELQTSVSKFKID